MSKAASAATLRRHFIDFFVSHAHREVSSASLIPANDPTLWFTNAGMNQFKDLFLGLETRDYRRAVSAQKCMRVSGKHNDLEEVGRTARHHTFFEMLGNFSFGDYFKDEAIELAWTFLTHEVALDPKRLWITVFGGGQLGQATLQPDLEARQLWRKVSGFEDAKILDMGFKDNFWSMGDTGPCGPCTEIHYDLRPDPTAPATEDDFESGRIVEIWNNVFMQYDRDAQGALNPLPKPSVDTGMGLERLTALVQGQDSNYHTDLFTPILETIAECAGKTYRRSDAEDDVSMRVIADHARATAFLVADGIQPSNEGRGYVMRRIMRRAIRHGRQLGLDDLFFDKVCASVVEHMKPAFAELADAAPLIQKVAENEEKGFRRTLENGMHILEQAMQQLPSGGVLPGDTVFKLYDTYGFPKDLTELIAQERGLQIDTAGFESALQAQQERSRGSAVGQAAIGRVYQSVQQRLQQSDSTIEFIGYPHESIPLSDRAQPWREISKDGRTYLQAECKVLALLQNGQEVDAAVASSTHETGSALSIEIIVDPCPLYGESGGQIGDLGLLGDHKDDEPYGRITDTQKPLPELTVCHVQLQQGRIEVGQSYWIGYDVTHRRGARAHHSATHLVHHALRKTLGGHVQQAGSLVENQRLRFDFSHFEAVPQSVLDSIEADVNAAVESANPTQTDVTDFESAKDKGAIALFGEKYGDVVRVVQMGTSIEFCGGTHVNETSEIGAFLITSEESVKSGVRRLEAVCGDAALRHVSQIQNWMVAIQQESTTETHSENQTHPIFKSIDKVAQKYKEFGGTWPPPPPLPTEHTSGYEQVSAIRNQWRSLNQVVQLKASTAPRFLDALDQRQDPFGWCSWWVQTLQTLSDLEKQQSDSHAASLKNISALLSDQITQEEDIAILASTVELDSAKRLRELADLLRQKHSKLALALAHQHEDKLTVLVAYSPALTKAPYSFHAGQIIREHASLFGGRGGGKPDFAQAGGNNPDGIPQFFEHFKNTVRQPLPTE